VHQNAGNQIVLSRDLEILINDEKLAWKKGQTLRLVFDDELVLGIYDVKIKTDAANRTNTGQYGKLVAALDNIDFGASNKPIFDIICMNEQTLSFRVDKIR
jgi:hypothetical protein